MKTIQTNNRSLVRLFGTIIALCIFHTLPAQNETGIPFTKNFLPTEYNGHTQNFDVTEDAAGNIYVANFAGILVYNGADWNRVLTPDISRVTCVQATPDGTVLVGGLNEIGLIKTSENGSLIYKDLRQLLSDESEVRFGEINKIISTPSKSFFFARDKVLVYDGKTIDIIAFPQGLLSVFQLADDFLIKAEDYAYYLLSSADYRLEAQDYLNPELEITDILPLSDSTFLVGTANLGLMQLKGKELGAFETSLNELLPEAKVSDLLQVNASLIAIGTRRNGLFFMDAQGNTITKVDRSLGLQNDYINKLYRDKGDRIWIALNNGISLVAYPWAWTFYNRANGLKSGVVSITRHDADLLVGTYQGLYTLDNSRKNFVSIPDIETACWQFLNFKDHLLAATGEGIYKIEDGSAQQLTTSFALCLAAPAKHPDYFYAGTLDGFMEIRLNADGTVAEERILFENLGEVTAIIPDNKGSLWISTLNGKLAQYNIQQEKLQFVGEEQNLPGLLGSQFYYFNDKIIVGTTRGLMAYNYTSEKFEDYEIKADSTNGAIEWPGLISEGKNNSMWMTRGDETGLSHFIKKDNRWLYQKRSFGPFENFICRSIYEDVDGLMWFGGPAGLIRFDYSQSTTINNNVQVKIASITLNNDSTLYGGFGDEELQEYALHYDYRNVSFRFSSSGYNAENQVKYSYFLKGHDKDWSEWSTDNEREYQKLAAGNYTLYVKAIDVYGNLSSTEAYSFELLFPWYLKWYMVIVYLLALGYSVWLIVQLRLRNLVREKKKLESTVRERTSEIREQRDEIQQKSEELSAALSDLRNTQEELIRQEKLASVGQMTKGIVDRIINPLNYINNFSSLSGELTTELTEVVDDFKEIIPEEARDELLDISNMLKMNLTKIQDHGGSTVRIVKGMEELLKDRTGRFVTTDMAELVTQTVKRVQNNFKKEIEVHAIEVDMQKTGEDFELKAISDELIKVVYELCDNALQSVVNHSEKNDLKACFVKLNLIADKEALTLEVRDNGMGIPEKEIGQIFDPFFTTKPTAKGSGIGLYLVREILYLHDGKIHVSSTVGAETLFKIVLPRKKKTN